MAKTQVNVRLDAKTLELLNRLCEAVPGSQADVVTRAIRQLARKELPKAKDDADKR